MAKELKTKNYEFDCDYCIPFRARNQLFVRISNSNLQEIAKVFSDKNELSALTYCGKPVYGYQKCVSINDEGAQYFLILG